MSNPNSLAAYAKIPKGKAQAEALQLVRKYGPDCHQGLLDSMLQDPESRYSKMDPRRRTKWGQGLYGRLNSLKNDGWITEVGVKEDPITGNEVGVYRANDQAVVVVKTQP